MRRYKDRFWQQLGITLIQIAILQSIWLFAWPCSGQRQVRGEAATVIAQPISSESRPVRLQKPNTVNGNTSGTCLIPSRAEPAVPTHSSTFTLPSTPYIANQSSTAMEIARATCQRSSPSKAVDGLRMILTPIHDFDFGSAITGPTGGAITVSPTGQVTCSGSAVIEPTAVVKPAEFRYTILDAASLSTELLLPKTAVAQFPNQDIPINANIPTLFKIAQGTTSRIADSNLVSIMMPKEITMQHNGSGCTLKVDRLSFIIEGNRIIVGGTLHLPPNLPAGDYSGNYSISINRE